MNLKEKRRLFFESLDEEEEKKFFGVPVHEDIRKFSKGHLMMRIPDKLGVDTLATKFDPKIKVSKKSCKKKCLISHDSKWKHIFDMFILILTCYSCISILYNVTFLTGVPLTPIHYVLESLFGLSIVLSFFHKYQDSDTLEIKDSYKSIAKNYIFKGWFVIDVVTIVPYEVFSQNTSLFKLIRLIRLPKIVEIIGLSRFDKLVDSFFTGSKNDKLIIMFNMRYFFKIIRLIIMAVVITYFVGCFWYLFCDNMSVNYPGEKQNFISYYHLNERNGFDRLVISCYFALTTLTTVGYGDYVAINNAERIFAIFIMLLGVGLFTYVMGSFTDLISGYDKKLGVSDKGSDLHNWLSLLGKFSNNKPFNSDLIKKIDRHFSFFWKNDRNNSISKDDPHLTSLPKTLRLKVMEFLWGDILNKFSNFFLYYSVNKDKFFKFYYEISFCLLPRRFLPGEFIYKPNEDIEEMYLLSDGYVEIGYSLYDHDPIKYCKYIKSVDWIGEFYCLFNVKSKYYYTAGSDLKTFGINKYDLLNALEKHSDLYTKIRTKAYRRYHEYFKKVMEKVYQDDLKLLLKEGRTSDVKLNNFEYSFELDPQHNQNGVKINKLLQKKLDKKNEEIKNIIYEVEKKFVKLDDDYANISRYLFDLGVNCEKDLINMNSELDEVQKVLNVYLESTKNK